MDREQVRETIRQLVESHHDQRDALTRLRNFEDANDPPPLAPSEFESLEAFLDFYDHHHDHEIQMRSLEAERTNATERYDQARVALSQVLPTNVLLHYTYEGNHEELKGQQYSIMNASGPGRGQIRISSRAPQL